MNSRQKIQVREAQLNKQCVVWFTHIVYTLLGKNGFQNAAQHADLPQIRLYELMEQMDNSNSS